MNLPNKLTLFRVILVPFFMIGILIPTIVGENATPLLHLICDLAAAALFAIASITDMLDGMIARKKNLITDFGKFLDPIADKLLVFGAFLAFLASNDYAYYRVPFMVCVFIVLLREFAVTSLRYLVLKGGGEVMAAALPGKIKTVTQMIFILLRLLEGHLFAFDPFWAKYLPLSCCACVLMVFFTIYSGVLYFSAGLKYIDPAK